MVASINLPNVLLKFYLNTWNVLRSSLCTIRFQVLRVNLSSYHYW